MMTTLFFLLLVLPFLMEINTVLHPSKHIAIVNLKVIKEIKEAVDAEMKKSLAKSIVGRTSVEILYSIFTILGMVLATQWILFVILFVLGFISGGLKKLIKNVIFHKIVIVIDSCISTVILGYIIFNHFHHLNLIPTDLPVFLHFIKLT